MFHPNRNSRQTSSRPTPEVADREPQTDCPDTELNLSIDPASGEMQDLASFKVFLKRNLPNQAPPADLLASIYDRVDQIKAETR